jgi:hypothetical protein
VNWLLQVCNISAPLVKLFTAFLCNIHSCASNRYQVSRFTIFVCCLLSSVFTGSLSSLEFFNWVATLLRVVVGVNTHARRLPAADLRNLVLVCAEQATQDCFAALPDVCVSRACVCASVSVSVCVFVSVCLCVCSPCEQSCSYVSVH